MSRRVERFSSTLKQCLADILMNEISDPRLKFVLITDIIVSSDLKKARIFIACIDDEIDDMISRLNHAGGFLKRTLAKKMYLKYVPDLLFIKDESQKETQDGSSAFEE